jgi:pimeloyl-ACP methyl ester carboxylesterase
MRCLFGFTCVLALAALGCSETTGTGGSGGTAPGTLLLAEEVDPFGPGMKVWYVRYGSEAIDGAPIEVSGIVAAPTPPPDNGLRDVVTFGHGARGLFDPCAPSSTGLPWLFNGVAPQLVDAGYVFAATDYEGLGTPGIHPYIVGQSEGRSVLDIVRAARQIEEAGSGNRAVVWGVSQGGHAALFAGEIAPEWAPEIEVLGIVSAAPASELVAKFDYDVMTPDMRGGLWEVALAWEAVYPGLALEDGYDADTIRTIRQLADQEACSGDFHEAARDVENAGLVADPREIPAWRERLVENSPGRVRSEMPILLLQGSADVKIPQWTTDLLFDRLCDTGSQTDYRVFEGYNHFQSLTLNVPAALEWTAARFAGDPAADTCPE